MPIALVADDQVERVVRKVLAEVLPAALAGASVGMMRAIRDELGVEQPFGADDEGVHAEIDAQGGEFIEIVQVAMAGSVDDDDEEEQDAEDTV